MNFTKLNRYIAAGIFAVTLVMYGVTTQSSVAFWDCGEFAATAYSMEVPHPPGAPLWTLLGRVAMMTPIFSDPGFRINFVSAIASALTIFFMYLIGVRIISRWRGFPTGFSGALVVFGSAAIAALTYSVTDTFWFNAVESEVYATSMFFVSCIIWLGLVWYEKADEPGNERYLLLIAYLMGLSIGVHQLSLLAYFTVALFVYFRFHELDLKKSVYFGVITVLSFGVIYPVIVNWLPGILDGDVQIGPIHITDSLPLRLLPLVVVAGAVYGIYRSHKEGRRILNVSLTAALLVVLGYSTYTLILIRANAHPPINENNPSTLTRLVTYLNREQYGEQPSIFDRRWDHNDPAHVRNYQNYSSDFDFFWKYQFNRMFLRYLGWNFIGRTGDVQNAPVALVNTPEGWFDGTRGYPARYFGIPLLVALFGLWYHFRRDWKFALAFLSLFLAMGAVLAVYFNMAEPQPRERDYFFVGSFFVLALWIGTGVSGILERLAALVDDPRRNRFITSGIAIALFLIIPVNMFAENYFSHNRRGNYIPKDYSYNILQSCGKNAILFTNGDNDTFPLWYMQEVMGIRTDVRVVCLSLLNTEWYILQLKNETPHGALKVPISFTDQQIEEIARGPMAWRRSLVQIPVPQDVYRSYGITDTSITNRGSIEFIMNPTIGAGEIQGIRVQDIMVRNIVESNNWRRPIQFAVTVSSDNFIGMQSYLEMQGMALTLMPFQQNKPGSDYRINEDIMKKCLYDVPSGYHTEQRYGFKFTNMNNPSVFFDENARRMSLNYRNPYMRLAMYEMQKGRPDQVVAALDSMESRIPIEIIPIDYRILFDVAKIYYGAGANEKFEKYAAVVEKDALAAIERNPMDVRNYYNPYSILIEIYSARNDYSKQIDLFRRLQRLFPNEQAIEQRISELELLMRKQSRSNVDSVAK